MRMFVTKQGFIRIIMAGLLSLAMASGLPASADPASEPTLLPLPLGINLWQKERLAAADRGFAYSFSYFQELIQPFHTWHEGKHKKPVYLDSLMLRLDVDVASASLGRRGKFQMSLLGNSGTSMTGEHLDPEGIGRIGDLQGLSWIQGDPTFRLFEFWYEQPMASFSLKLGMMDFCQDFYASWVAAFFANSSFGIGPEMSGNFTVSSFNVNGLGCRLSWKPMQDLTLKTGIYDGNPGDTKSNRHGLTFKFSGDEGFLTATELELMNPWRNPDLPGMFHVGGWHHSGRFDDQTVVDDAGDPVRRRGNWGWYWNFEQKVFNEGDDPEQGLSFFVQGGSGVPGDRSLITGYDGIGLTYTGLFGKRDKDTLGIAYAVAETSPTLRAVNIDAGSPYLTRERVIEVGYQAKITEYWSVKPFFELIKNVGADPTKSESRVFGVRSDILF